MADFDPKTLDDWRTLAAKDLKGGDPGDLVWQTPEGIAVKPLYTAADLEGLELDSLPGFPPYLRGPRASMYAGRPWTIRQYAGFATTIRASRCFCTRSMASPSIWFNCSKYRYSISA